MQELTWDQVREGDTVQDVGAGVTGRVVSINKFSVSIQWEDLATPRNYSKPTSNEIGHLFWR